MEKEVNFHSIEIQPFDKFESKVLDFFIRNNKSCLGLAFGGSSIEVKRKNQRYSDIDSNIIIKEKEIPDFFDKLQKDSISIGTYFDSISQYPLIHSLIDGGGRLFRLDVFLFVPKDELIFSDPFRTIPRMIKDDLYNLFGSLSISRPENKLGVEFENANLHLIDWFFYMWNKTMRQIPIEKNNIELLKKMVWNVFSIDITSLEFSDINTPNELLKFVFSIKSRDEFDKRLNNKNRNIFSRLSSQMMSDLSGC